MLKPWRILLPINLNAGSKIPVACPYFFRWIQFSHVYPQTGLHAYVPCKSIKTCQDCLVSLALLNVIYHTQNLQKRTGNEWSLIICCQIFEVCIFHLCTSLALNKMLRSHSRCCIWSPLFPLLGIPHIGVLQCGILDSWIRLFRLAA